MKQLAGGNWSCFSLIESVYFFKAGHLLSRMFRTENETKWYLERVHWIEKEKGRQIFSPFWQYSGPRNQVSRPSQDICQQATITGHVFSWNIFLVLAEFQLCAEIALFDQIRLCWFCGRNKSLNWMALTCPALNWPLLSKGTTFTFRCCYLHSCISKINLKSFVGLKSALWGAEKIQFRGLKRYKSGGLKSAVAWTPTWQHVSYIFFPGGDLKIFHLSLSHIFSSGGGLKIFHLSVKRDFVCFEAAAVHMELKRKWK